MYRIKGQKNDDLHTTAEVFPPDFMHDYGSLGHVTDALVEVADDYAATWCAHVFHDDIGISTVYFDDGQYTCFWFSDIGE